MSERVNLILKLMKQIDLIKLTIFLLVFGSVIYANYVHTLRIANEKSSSAPLNDSVCELC